jgi:hypothetical protein
MGHSTYTWKQFDSALTRPLYGYLGDVRDGGQVPPWVEQPKVQGWKVVDLFDLDRDRHDEIPRHALPSGVSKVGQGFGEYNVDPQRYLDACRDRIGTANRPNQWKWPTFELDMDDKRSGFGSTYTSFPEDIRGRLEAITETSMWDRRIDGYHESFHCWELEYTLGPRGGIQDVAIVANTHH